MSTSAKNTISLRELLDILRCGLSSLVPIVERAGIPWREGEAYDDWDAIASVLYEQLIVNVLRAANELSEMTEFPNYDLVYPSYDGMAFFEVYSLATDHALGVFVGFDGCNPEFDSIKYLNVNEQNPNPSSVPFVECGVRLHAIEQHERPLESVTLCD